MSGSGFRRTGIVPVGLTVYVIKQYQDKPSGISECTIRLRAPQMLRRCPRILQSPGWRFL